MFLFRPFGIHRVRYFGIRTASIFGGPNPTSGGAGARQRVCDEVSVRSAVQPSLSNKPPDDGPITDKVRGPAAAAAEVSPAEMVVAEMKGMADCFARTAAAPLDSGQVFPLFTNTDKTKQQSTTKPDI